MTRYDICVIGAGIAGLSLAARLAEHASVLVVEAESAPGYHASGRSVAFAHFGLGERVVRTLTALSLEELAADPSDDRARPAEVHSALHIASRAELSALDALEKVHRDFGCDFERLSGEEAAEIAPALKIGPEHCHSAILDHGSLKLDADAMLQGHVRDIRAHGGRLEFSSAVRKIARAGEDWVIDTESDSFSAPILINAAGAWADAVAGMIGARPIGIEPRRRTVISFSGPEGSNVSHWPFVKTVGAGFYMLPEGAGQLLASPMDEGASEPCDAAPEEFDIATIAHRIEEATRLKVARITHSWAGLRSFARDELPVVGFAKDAPGFFWCAGQGGAGFQTSPALSRIGEVLVRGEEWPGELAAQGLTPALFSPARLSA
ncbi:FAD dependent oxidoreductase [Erythrobacter sp. NAP1]|uniref:NAD(P)/FAD-dependent oxidoreductase n=1 Tax=Erythrobacter sp. NAP1 TaxID=237727 RepID=UPI000068693C|nr:FAD-dependent oxidoreductase [Erythrobacter sp. NAP1]EAQ29911.1 FAD dependent oxidoreductase [Erythrobacter sp. NAP1]